MNGAALGSPASMEDNFSPSLELGSHHHDDSRSKLGELYSPSVVLPSEQCRPVLSALGRSVIQITSDPSLEFAAAELPCDL